MFKKILLFTLCALFAAFALSAAQADTGLIATEEELLGAIAAHREAGDTKFELKMTDELYAAVKAGSFSRFRQLELLSGIEDDSLRYSLSGGVIELSDVVWGDVHAAECAAIDEVQQAVSALLGKGFTQFEIICSDELFETLRQTDYITFYAAQNGVSDMTLKYSSSFHTFYASGIVYGSVMAKACETEEDVFDAIADLAASRPDKYTLLCAPQLYDSLHENDLIYYYAAMNGLEDITLRYRKPFYYLSEATPCSLPWASAADEQGFRTAIEEMQKQNADQFYIVFEPDFFDLVNGDKDKMRVLQATSQLEGLSSTRTSRVFRRIEYSGATFSTNPRAYCETEEDLTDVIRQMGGIGADSFNLVLSKDLYSLISADGFKRLRELQSDAGMSDASMKYDFFNYILYFTGAVIHSDAVKITSLEQLEKHMQACSERSDSEITLFLSPELYDSLMAGVSRFSFGKSNSMAPINDIAIQAGLYKYTTSYSSITHIVEFHVEAYYPGTRILNAVRSQDMSRLNARELETLKAAQEVAGQCMSGNPLTTARAIHDTICRMTVYDKDNVNDEKDTAIGVLLNGLADCDGYSDAFFLIGSLAGLNVRVQHGDSYSLGLVFDFTSSITHMWNLLMIDGTWRVVDVTWDDSETGDIRYTWFNIGADRAHRMHIWNEAFTVPLLEKTDLTVRPDHEYLVTCAEDAENAVRDAGSRGVRHYELICSDENAADYGTLLNAVRDNTRGSFRYEWNERMFTLTVRPDTP